MIFRSGCISGSLAPRKGDLSLQADKNMLYKVSLPYSFYLSVDPGLDHGTNFAKTAFLRIAAL